jgi:capsular exopolysaccharide synthesis family protein
VVAATVIVGLIVTVLMTPQYTASATLEIQRENYRVVNVEGVEPESSSVDQEFYQTQYGLLRSETLAERAAADLRLHEDPVFFEMFGETELAAEVRERGGRPDAGTRAERIRTAAGILLENLTVSPQRLSRLVTISFTSPDAALSARVVNAWTRLFIETSLGRRFEATSYARNFLEERLNQLRQRLQESERTLVGYAARQRIINVPSGERSGETSVTVERPLLAEDLLALNQELNEATAARIAAQSRLRSPGGSTGEALSNQALSEMRARRAQYASERAQMLAQFEPEYPPAVALADQIAELDRAITREETRIRSVLQANYDSASSREAALRSRVNALEGDVLDLRGRTIQYNIYQRDVDTNRQLYDALLQRYKEIGVAGGVGVNNISVVDPAPVPERPSSPNLILNMLIALLAGGVFGATLALFLDQTDEAISDPRALESRLGLPLLGTIPKSEEEALEELNDPKSPLVEAYLSTQARLAFTTDHGVPRTLVVTSTRPGEGKSTTAFALSQTLARTSKRIILVDADMRSPSQHEMFQVENARGLSNYLSGDDDLAALIQAKQPGSNLAVLSAGPTPPNAAELLTSPRLSKLLNELATRYDHVIVDAPPVMGLADTPLIAHEVEGCVFVVESHSTQATMAQVAVGRLRDSQARLLGALLTKFEARRANDGYGYGYEYGYGYGQSHAKGSA